MPKLNHATHRCGVDTVQGLSASGLEERVDAAPLNPEQELAAIVAGLRTFTLYVVPDQLHVRLAHHVRARPAGTHPRQTVHAEHRCTHQPGRRA